MRSSKETYRELFALASKQGGYFTAHQALSIGYTYTEQVYHTRRQNWERVDRSIYRLIDYPPADRDDLIVLSLKSMDRTDTPQAVVSHATALAIYDLSDINPASIHLSVPPGFRKHMPHAVILHRAVLHNPQIGKSTKATG